MNLPLLAASSASMRAGLWLLAWMANNIGVTLINKACFSSTVNFRYPYFLSAIHMVCNMAGAALMILYNKHNGNSCRNSKSLLPQQHRIHSSNIAINSSNEENYIPVNQILPLLKNGRASGGTLRKSPRLVTDFPKPLLCDPNDASTSSSSSSAFSRTKKKKKKKNTILWIRRPTLDAKEQRLILVFSVIFSLNIAIGNVSLRHVSVNFNQVMRSLVPVIAIALTYYGFHKSVSRRKILSVLPIVIGVVMTCFGDISFDTTGFMVTVACIVLAALKAVASGEMLTGALKLHPIDLLSRMAPLALIQCLGAAFAQGEMRQILRRWSTDFSPIVNPYPMAVVWVSGILSFSLNLCSLQATKATSPLTLCIAANVKQVLLIAISTVVFHVDISPLNGTGICVVLLSSAWYSYICLCDDTETSKLSQQQQDYKVSPMCDRNDAEAGLLSASEPFISDRSCSTLLHRHF